jgi:hypothetical protein
VHTTREALLFLLRTSPRISLGQVTQCHLYLRWTAK